MGGRGSPWTCPRPSWRPLMPRNRSEGPLDVPTLALGRPECDSHLPIRTPPPPRLLLTPSQPLGGRECTRSRTLGHKPKGHACVHREVPTPRGTEPHTYPAKRWRGQTSGRVNREGSQRPASAVWGVGPDQGPGGGGFIGSGHNKDERGTCTAHAGTGIQHFDEDKLWTGPRLGEW